MFFFHFFLHMVYCLFGIPKKLDYAIPTRFFVFLLVSTNLIEFKLFRVLAKQSKNTESWMKARIAKYQIYLFFSFFPSMFIRIINDEFRGDNWQAHTIVGACIKGAMGLFSLYYVAYVRSNFVDWFYKSILNSLLLAQSIFFLLTMCMLAGYSQYNESIDYYAQYKINKSNLS